jgi:geranylgeranyl pyrophosphate synthase
MGIAVAEERQLAPCRDRLRAVAFQSGSPDLAAMVNGAKLLRAALLLACGTSLGAAPATLVPAAVSIELLHLASLVHDDIIDDAPERRGLPALHVAVGRDRALVLGDLLIAVAFAELSAGRRGVAAASVETLSQAARLCCLGELQELDPERQPYSEDDYVGTITKKSGALFAAAASLGALAAEAQDEEVAALSEFGAQLGVVYQIRDDIRDGHDGVPTAATAATLDRARDRLAAALAGVPPPSEPALRALIGAIDRVLSD